ncbi:MAG TPA: Gfo/Idh/MocA family oxidoreductase [Candidatus Dormibacteraeota bacterium]|jgi:predicted dehydrogenase|nr:Gfo/Idh/MocA family oxidoreductase [Candidatus Dormibacteraeota bacterium]
MSPTNFFSRRKFIKNATIGGATLTIVPRYVLGRGMTPPSDLLNIAGVGIGGMGRANLINLASQNVVALCDVDWDYAGKSFERLSSDIPRLEGRINQPENEPQSQTRSGLNPAKAQKQLENMKRLYNEHWQKAKRYKDYREMLDKQKDIDAVVVATPDHMHAPIALAAMALGKHVYVQKPLTWCVSEARQLAQRAKETKVATQMGNQGHSADDARLAVEYIQSGAIGEVREIHVWTNRPLGFWPQGVPRPEPLPASADSLKWSGRDVNTRLAAAMAGDYPIPDTLSWSLFLGVGPEVQYHPVYHPFNWRGWVDWGVGAIGDMGAHLLDVSLWALDLGLPTSVETISTPFNKASYPLATQTYFEFPARGKMPPVKLTWYDGGLLPPKPVEMAEDEEVNKDGGALLVGSKGKLLHDTYGLRPRLLPKSLADSTPKPAQKLLRIKDESHELNWVDAAKGKTVASCPFEYAAILAEIMLLGVVALRAGKKLSYDPANMRVTNVADANQYLKRDYRTGW